MLTNNIVYLRRQQNLLSDMKAKCPKVADTRWLSMGKVCRWFVLHRATLLEYYELKKPNCTPPGGWWISVAFIAKLMKEIDMTFVANQGLRTLIHEQKCLCLNADNVWSVFWMLTVTMQLFLADLWEMVTMMEVWT